MATVCGSLKAKLDELNMRAVWLPNVTVTRAPEHGVNAGALYLKAHGEYLGKITADGQLRTVAVVAPVIKEELRGFVTGGKEYLAEVGREWGNCCFCGLLLTDPESVERGYGPVCARKNGLPHGNRHGF